MGQSTMKLGQATYQLSGRHYSKKRISREYTGTTVTYTSFQTRVRLGDMSIIGNVLWESNTNQGIWRGSKEAQRAR